MLEINSIKIKQLRNEKGLSFNELARKAGLSTHTVIRVERGLGKVRPRENTLKKIADVFSIAVHDLIKGAPREVPYPSDPESAGGKVRMNSPLYKIQTESDLFGQAVADLRKIFDSRDQVLIAAVVANLFSFRCAIDTQKENEDLRKEVSDFKKRLEVLERSMENKG